MKSLRVFAICCVLLVGTGFFTGCATTGGSDGWIEPPENRQWDDMTTAQKIGNWMWWPLQEGIYYGCEALANSTR